MGFSTPSFPMPPAIYSLLKSSPLSPFSKRAQRRGSSPRLRSSAYRYTNLATGSSKTSIPGHLFGSLIMGMAQAASFRIFQFDPPCSPCLPSYHLISRLTKNRGELYAFALTARANLTVISTPTSSRYSRSLRKMIPLVKWFTTRFARTKARFFHYGYECPTLVWDRDVRCARTPHQGCQENSQVD